MSTPQMTELGAAMPVLCVDLDGTLIRSDTLYEQLLLLAKTDPLRGLLIWGTLRKGIAAFKREVCSRVHLRAETLPYNQPFIDYLRQESNKGRRILLATAADQYVAERVACHLGLFEVALASDGVTNLKAKAKLAAIQRYLSGAAFEYAGDSAADLPIWKESAGAIVVGPPVRFRQTLHQSGVQITKEFRNKRPTLATFTRAIRVHQWSKNILVFAPLFLSHTLSDSFRLTSAVIAFAALSAAASAIYLANDLLDLQSDRQHPRKRNRPLASGAITIPQGIVLSGVLLCAAMLLAALLPAGAQMFLVLYVATTTAYSLFLKRMLFLDITALAGLYTCRILYGGAATEIKISPWTIGFAIFWFSSLAICKRLTELRNTTSLSDAAVPGRAYSQSDLPAVIALGAASGYVGVLILSLYLNSPEVTVLYRKPQFLWALCPIFAYWISRMLILANRGNMHDDPIVFACQDRASHFVAFVTLIVILISL